MEWAGAFGAIGAALVSGVFAVLITRLRRENTDQHAANQAKLEAIGDDVGEVKTDVREVRSSQIRHLEWHAEK
tara:strand:- start:953 stop:1171 length:219 start_codon:yes stop_codon:yes gene_type:complete